MIDSCGEPQITILPSDKSSILRTREIIGQYQKIQLSLYRLEKSNKYRLLDCITSDLSH